MRKGWLGLWGLLSVATACSGAKSRTVGSEEIGAGGRDAATEADGASEPAPSDAANQPAPEDAAADAEDAELADGSEPALPDSPVRGSSRRIMSMRRASLDPRISA